MKARIICLISAMIVAATFMSCEYFGSFKFTISNNTEDTVFVSITPQYRTLEDILPTGNKKKRPEVDLQDTTLVILPLHGMTSEMEVGQVSSSFPTKDDVPEKYGIIPMWHQIVRMVVGNDTVENSCYAKEKWVRNGNEYVLNIRHEKHK